VVIVKTSSDNPAPDPIVFLVSSPSPVVEDANGLVYFLRGLSSDRDLIVMEQRGVGRSDPNLECPDLTDFYYQNLDKDPRSPELQTQNLDLQRACHEQFVKSGINLAAYTSETSAADFEDLRLTLKYDQWNLFSIGYGSRLALLSMRKYPQGLRSAVLDSPLPPQVNFFASGAVQAEQALDLMFQRCAESEECNTTFPDLKNVFYVDIELLNAHPQSLVVIDPQTGDPFQMWADGNTLISVVLMAVDYAFQDILLQVPRMLYQIKEGKYEGLAELMPMLVNNAPFSVGMQNLVFCQEDLDQISFEKIQEANSQAEPELAQYFNNQVREAQESCAIWRVDPDAVVQGAALVKEPIHSDVPTLVFSGDFSWNTPSNWAEETARALNRATWVNFAGSGGAVTFSEMWSSCSLSIGKFFFNDPQASLDTSCAGQKKTFDWETNEPGQ